MQMKASFIPVHDGDLLSGLRGFLRSLLETQVVEGLLVTMRTPYGTLAPALVTDPAMLDLAEPLAPVMNTNAGTLVANLTARHPHPRLGAILRPCELRALVELVKLKQASLQDVLLIAIDCAGTLDAAEYSKLSQDVGEAASDLGCELYRSTAGNSQAPDERLRSACQMCEYPAYPNPPGAHVRIELFGSDLKARIGLVLPEDLAAQLDMQAEDQDLRAPAIGNREAILEEIIAARSAVRDKEFTGILQRLDSEGGLPAVFAACLRCHNCMTVCPICYCKTCVFKSAIFDHEPAQFFAWAKQKGALRLPGDTVLFHLTRLNHMGLSCIGCGMCTQACPVDLPVGLAFRAIGQRLQNTFAYTPGLELDQPLPLVTFKADEWTEVGE